jgi:hypothetical protein
MGNQEATGLDRYSEDSQSNKGRTRSGNALLECGLLQKVVLGAHIKNPKP